MTRKQLGSDPQGMAPSGRGAPVLTAGTRLGLFEVLRVVAQSACSTTYLATDHALGIQVAIQEYLPARFVLRDADQCLRALDPAHDPAIALGRQAFIEEARMLARCDHPSLARVSQLFDANGTSYRVTPFYDGQPLSDRMLFDKNPANFAVADEHIVRPLKYKRIVRQHVQQRITHGQSRCQ